MHASPCSALLWGQRAGRLSLLLLHERSAAQYGQRRKGAAWVLGSRCA